MSEYTEATVKVSKAVLEDARSKFGKFDADRFNDICKEMSIKYSGIVDEMKSEIGVLADKRVEEAESETIEDTRRVEGFFSSRLERYNKKRYSDSTLETAKDNLMRGISSNIVCSGGGFHYLNRYEGPMGSARGFSYGCLWDLDLSYIYNEVHERYRVNLESIYLIHSKAGFISSLLSRVLRGLESLILVDSDEFVIPESQITDYGLHGTGMIEDHIQKLDYMINDSVGQE